MGKDPFYNEGKCEISNKYCFVDKRDQNQFINHSSMHRIPQLKKSKHKQKIPQKMYFLIFLFTMEPHCE